MGPWYFSTTGSKSYRNFLVYHLYDTSTGLENSMQCTPAHQLVSHEFLWDSFSRCMSTMSDNFPKSRNRLLSLLTYVKVWNCSVGRVPFTTPLVPIVFTFSPPLSNVLAPCGPTWDVYYYSGAPCFFLNLWPRKELYIWLKLVFGRNIKIQYARWTIPRPEHTMKRSTTQILKFRRCWVKELCHSRKTF